MENMNDMDEIAQDDTMNNYEPEIAEFMEVEEKESTASYDDVRKSCETILHFCRGKKMLHEQISKVEAIQRDVQAN